MKNIEPIKNANMARPNKNAKKSSITYPFRASIFASSVSASSTIEKVRTGAGLLGLGVRDKTPCPGSLSVAVCRETPPPNEIKEADGLEPSRQLACNGEDVICRQGKFTVKPHTDQAADRDAEFLSVLICQERARQEPDATVQSHLV